jgi:hypothetical protein
VENRAIHFSCSRFQEFAPASSKGRSVSKLDEAYVALRNLLKARLLSPSTRESALRAVDRLYGEALAQTVLKSTEPEETKAESSEPPAVL